MYNSQDILAFNEQYNKYILEIITNLSKDTNIFLKNIDILSLNKIIYSLKDTENYAETTHCIKLYDEYTNEKHYRTFIGIIHSRTECDFKSYEIGGEKCSNTDFMFTLIYTLLNHLEYKNSIYINDSSEFLIKNDDYIQTYIYTIIKQYNIIEDIITAIFNQHKIDVKEILQYVIQTEDIDNHVCNTFYNKYGLMNNYNKPITLMIRDIYLGITNINIILQSIITQLSSIKIDSSIKVNDKLISKKILYNIFYNYIYYILIIFLKKCKIYQIDINIINKLKITSLNNVIENEDENILSTFSSDEIKAFNQLKNIYNSPEKLDFIFNYSCHTLRLLYNYYELIHMNDASYVNIYNTTKIDNKLYEYIQSFITNNNIYDIIELIGIYISLQKADSITLFNQCKGKFKIKEKRITSLRHSIAGGDYYAYYLNKYNNLMR